MKLICNLPIYFLDFEIQSHSQARPNLWIADPFHIKYRVKFRNKLQCREDIYIYWLKYPTDRIHSAILLLEDRIERNFMTFFNSWAWHDINFLPYLKISRFQFQKHFYYVDFFSSHHNFLMNKFLVCWMASTFWGYITAAAVSSSMSSTACLRRPQGVSGKTREANFLCSEHSWQTMNFKQFQLFTTTQAASLEVRAS